MDAEIAIGMDLEEVEAQALVAVDTTQGVTRLDLSKVILDNIVQVEDLLLR